MAIENRDLPVGAKLVASYHKEHQSCEVVEVEGKKMYRMGGVDFKSLSAATLVVTGGSARSAWLLWSIEGTEPVKVTKTDKGTKIKAKAQEPANKKETKPVQLVTGELPAEHEQVATGNTLTKADQKDVPVGFTRWACASCPDTFLVEGDQAPVICLAGHRNG